MKTDEEHAQDVDRRYAEATAAFNALSGGWVFFAAEMRRMRDRHVEALILEENQELRGRIKQIDELLLLPQYLRQEIQNLSESLPK